MVDYLEGNYVLWQMRSIFRTTFDGGRKVIEFEGGHLLNPLTGPLLNNINNFAQMPFGGKFVGIIVNVLLNQMSPLFNPAVEWEFIKTEDSGTTFVPTGLKVEVPGGETGFFFSNTDISEFTRTWEADEYIALRQTKLATPSFAGTGPATIMILLDLEPT